jgi:peptidoglycan/xylan/chitin deacetylase (PgdA/CDA1 family)
MRSRWTRGVLVLGYHHIGLPEADPYQNYVTSAHLAEHLDELRQRACLLPLAEAIARLKTGTLPARAVALTFDDGYADTLYAAKPRLESLGMPATVFVTTGTWGREHWWDELSRLALQAPAVISGHAHSDGKPGARRGTNERASGRPLEQCVNAYYRRLLHLAPAERQLAIESLRSRAGAAQSQPHPWRALTTAEVVQLAEGGLIDIGAHTVTHPVLSELSLPEQWVELTQSKAELEGLLRRPVTGFSYPNGARAQNTRDMVVQAGFSYACASQPGVAHARSDCFTLPRFWVPDCDGGRFRRWLNLWLTR